MPSKLSTSVWRTKILKETTCRGIGSTSIVILRMPRKYRYVVLLLTAHWCFAQRNITIDDNDSSITYVGQDWEVSAISQLDVGGTHHLSTTDPKAHAMVNFTGVLIDSWSYKLNSQSLRCCCVFYVSFVALSCGHSSTT